MSESFKQSAKTKTTTPCSLKTAAMYATLSNKPPPPKKTHPLLFLEGANKGKSLMCSVCAKLIPDNGTSYSRLSLPIYTQMKPAGAASRHSGCRIALAATRRQQQQPSPGSNWQPLLSNIIASSFGEGATDVSGYLIAGGT